jgi:hypothetical protein
MKGTLYMLATFYAPRVQQSTAESRYATRFHKLSQNILLPLDPACSNSTELVAKRVAAISHVDVVVWIKTSPL